MRRPLERQKEREWWRERGRKKESEILGGPAVGGSAAEGSGAGGSSGGGSRGGGSDGRGSGRGRGPGELGSGAPINKQTKPPHTDLREMA